MKEELEKLQKLQLELDKMSSPHEPPSKDGNHSAIELWQEKTRFVLLSFASKKDLTAFDDIFKHAFLNLRPTDAGNLRRRSLQYMEYLIAQVDKKIKNGPGFLEKLDGKSQKIFKFIKDANESIPIVITALRLLPIMLGGGILAWVGESCGLLPAEKLSVTVPAFDVAQCHSRPPAPVEPLNEAMLSGVITSARPLVMECLVDPKARATVGPAEATVETIVDNQSGTHRVSGKNLSLAGQQCIQTALETHAPVDQLRSSSMVGSRLDFIQEPGASVPVIPSGKAGADFAGTVRVAQAQWCDCYAGFSSRIPPSLKMTVHLSQGQMPRVDPITVAPAGTAEAEQLATCLQKKVMSLQAAAISHETELTLELVHLNSLATGPSNLPPEPRYAQYGLALHHRSAEVLLALGPYLNAEAAYKEIKIDPSPTAATFSQIRDAFRKRNTVLETLQKPKKALESKIATLEELLNTLRVLKAKEPQAQRWDNEETRVLKTLGEIQQALDGLRKRDDELRHLQEQPRLGTETR